MLIACANFSHGRDPPALKCNTFSQKERRVWYKKETRKFCVFSCARSCREKKKVCTNHSLMMRIEDFHPLAWISCCWVLVFVCGVCAPSCDDVDFLLFPYYIISMPSFPHLIRHFRVFHIIDFNYFTLIASTQTRHPLMNKTTNGQNNKSEIFCWFYFHLFQSNVYVLVYDGAVEMEVTKGRSMKISHFLLLLSIHSSTCTRNSVLFFMIDSSSWAAAFESTAIAQVEIDRVSTLLAFGENSITHRRLGRFCFTRASLTNLFNKRDLLSFLKLLQEY